MRLTDDKIIALFNSVGGIIMSGHRCYGDGGRQVGIHN